MRHQKQEIKLKKLRRLQQQVKNLEYYTKVGEKVCGYINYISLSDLGNKQKNKKFLEEIIKLCFENRREYLYDLRNYSIYDLLRKISIPEYISSKISKKIKSILKFKREIDFYNYHHYEYYILNNKYFKYFKINKKEMMSYITIPNIDNMSERRKINDKMKQEHGWEKLAHSNIYDDWDSLEIKNRKIEQAKRKEIIEEINDSTK